MKNALIVFCIGIVLLFCVLIPAFCTAQPMLFQESVGPFVERGEVPGIVAMVADRDRVLYRDCLGYSDRERQIPLSGDSLFWVASQSKSFCAVAIMALVEENKLSLSDSVVKYLPELESLRVKQTTESGETRLVKLQEPITIRHLLSHTSGMEWVTPLQQRFGIDVIPLQQMVVACAMTPLKTQPSEAYSYSNMGVEIAAAIVERVSGKPYEEFLQERIFDPLEMKQTTFWPSEDQLKRLALVYGWDKNQGKLIPLPTPQLTYPLSDRQKRHPAAAGGLFSTPGDMVKYWQMFLGEGTYKGVKILSPESVKTIATKQTGDLPNEYGLCVGTGGGRFGHGGACGTDSSVDIKNDRVYLFFIQESGCPKAGEAKKAFHAAIDRLNASK